MMAALARAADTAAISLFRRFIPMVIPTFQYSRSGCPITLPMEDCEDAEMACGTFQERCNARGESRLPSHPAIFWTAVAMISTAGTTLSDLMNRTGGIGYSVGALVLSTGLVIVFVAWWRSGQTLDVENIATFRGEMLYWIAILVSNRLGTSSGDFLADSLGLGFVPSVVVLSTALLALLALHYWTRVNGMLLFWIAFVLTLGANLGNVLTKEHGRGGLGWGTTWTSAALLAALIGLVAY
jgi:uncharacterized membrane-anchored protein